MSKKQYPVLGQDGRTVIGYASTVKGAMRVVSRNMTIPRIMSLHVWMRCPVMREINGGPMGWMYSISYDVGGVNAESRRDY